jgi:hypothetical protein
MTSKQKKLIDDMIDILDYEMDYGTIGKKSWYTPKQAYTIIGLNKDLFFSCVEDGQCSPKQYRQLTEIAGRTPRIERHHISQVQALEWIREYGKVS